MQSPDGPVMRGINLEGMFDPLNHVQVFDPSATYHLITGMLCNEDPARFRRPMNSHGVMRTGGVYPHGDTDRITCGAVVPALLTPADCDGIQLLMAQDAAGTGTALTFTNTNGDVLHIHIPVGLGYNELPHLILWGKIYAAWAAPTAGSGVVVQGYRAAI